MESQHFFRHCMKIRETIIVVKCTTYVKFSYSLDDILKQFKMVGSLKEQQVQSNKRTKDFSLLQIFLSEVSTHEGGASLFIFDS